MHVRKNDIILNLNAISSIISGAITCILSAAVRSVKINIDFNLLTVLLYILSTRVGEIRSYVFF
jgi:hypothetical protein